jgi:hypothetical protein
MKVTKKTGTLSFGDLLFVTMMMVPLVAKRIPHPSLERNFSPRHRGATMEFDINVTVPRHTITLHKN